MSGPAQLPLALGSWPSLAADDFVVTPANGEAVAWIERYPDWPATLVALHGPAGCGKSHLLHLWRQRSRAVLIEPAALSVAAVPSLLGPSRAVAIDFGAAEPGAVCEERALLHLYNLLRERQGHVLVAARAAPPRWALTLPDLRSRLGASASVAIAAPDDLLLAGVLGKLFADRQLRVPPGLIEYLVSRIERSLDAAARVVERLDRAALDRRRSLSVALAREVLDENSGQN